MNPQIVPIPFRDFMAELLELYRPPHRAHATFLKIRQALELAAGLIGDGTTADLTPVLVARIVEARPPGEAARTTHAILRNLRTACNYAEIRGYLRVSPFRFRHVGHWIRVGPPTRAKLFHSLEEIRRVLDLMRCDVEERRGWARWRAWRLYAVAATVAYTGMRKLEALHLQVADVDLAGRMLFIVSRGRNRLKTEGSAQPVPIPPALAAILADWLSHRLDAPEGEHVERGDWLFPCLRTPSPWTGGPTGEKPLDRLRELGRRAGVEGFTFHSLRHSFASHSESAWHLTPAQIQRILRHTSLRTQEHYRHPDLTNLRALAERIDFGPAAVAGEGPAS